VLNSLRNKARSGVDATKLVTGADSIDGAASQGEVRRQELWDWALHGKAPSWWSRRGDEPGGNASQRPMVQSEVHEDTDEEEFQRLVT
jgi:hypothetical protein